MVEDRPVSRQALTELLRFFGYNVLQAEDGKQALELLDKSRVKLVITDFVLPDIDGLKLIVLIRERRPRIAYYPDIRLSLTGIRRHHSCERQADTVFYQTSQSGNPKR